MASIIHATGHGMTAGTAFRFANVVPDTCGVTETTTYYVLASGLTADQFQFSTAPAGAAFVLTEAITDGSLVEIDTYAVVSDGVMDAPTAPATPAAPTLASSVLDSIVRLDVTIAAATATTRLSEVQITREYSGGTPVWTGAIVVSMPVGTTTFSVPCLGATDYSARVRRQDVYGNYSSWSSVTDHTTTAGADSLTGLAAQTTADGKNTVFYSDTEPTAIAINDLWFETDNDNKPYRWSGSAWVEQPLGNAAIANLDVGKLTAGSLSASVILAGILRTATSGTRVEFDSAGIRVYNGSSLVANIPTDGSNIWLNAEVVASSLTVTGNASIRGTANELTANSVTSLAAKITDPSQAPSVSAAVVTYTDLGGDSRRSWHYDSAGGAGGATAVWWTSGISPLNYAVIREYLASTRAQNRSYTYGSITASILGVARLSTYLYVLRLQSGSYYVDRFTASTLTLDTTYSSVSFPIATPRYPAIGSDGTNIIIADAAATTGYISWNLYDSAMAKVGSTVATSSAPGGTTYEPKSLQAGNADFGAWRLLLVGKNGASTAWAFDSTGARQSADDFALAGSTDYVGIGYDGSNLWTLQGLYTAYKFSGIKTSAIHWVGYTWYDSNSTGGTHETTISPRWNSGSAISRRFITVTTPAVPGSGGTDDPDNRRIYMYLGGSDPGGTGFKRQTTTTSLTTTLSTYDSGGTADPASNDFPAATPAQIKSSSTGWKLYGNGLVNRTGTAFPSSPATDDQYWRSDLDMEFFYDGTRWLSTELFRVDTVAATGAGITATTAGAYIQNAPVSPGSDIWLVETVTQFLINGGTALSGSHKWVGVLNKRPTGNTDTSIKTVTIDSGSSSVWRTDQQSIGALLNNGTTHYVFAWTWTKTGTPGELYARSYVTYRVVAT